MAGHSGSIFQGIYERDLGGAAFVGVDTAFMEDAACRQVNGGRDFTLELDMLGFGFTDPGNGA